jgi:NMD protein affecting ribosome stability and mRNA decay
MSKSNVMISLESELGIKAKQKLKGRVSAICEDAIRKELGIVENVPDELQQLEALLEVKQEVQRLSTADGGSLAVRVVAAKLKKELGRSPETFKEKLDFWQTIKTEVRKILIRGRLEGEKKVSPAPLPKGTHTGEELMNETCPHCQKEQAGYLKELQDNKFQLICRYCKKKVRE